MRLRRFVKAPIPAPQAFLDLQATGAFDWSLMFNLADGSGLYKCEVHEQSIADFQSVPGITVFPSLSTPADRLSTAIQTWLTGQGIAAAAGDTTLNLLRKLRDARISDPARRLRFNIDLRE